MYWSIEEYDRLMNDYKDTFIYYKNNKWYGEIKDFDIKVEQENLDNLYQFLYDARSDYVLRKLGVK